MKKSHNLPQAYVNNWYKHLCWRDSSNCALAFHWSSHRTAVYHSEQFFSWILDRPLDWLEFPQRYLPSVSLHPRSDSWHWQSPDRQVKIPSSTGHCRTNDWLPDLSSPFDWELTLCTEKFLVRIFLGGLKPNDLLEVTYMRHPCSWSHTTVVFVSCALRSCTAYRPALGMSDRCVGVRRQLS